ncbi:hypothetical protein EAH_00057460 [Eimeria acervulina]|uniref:Uncharacterized protein n=1 Tax=Eimeria acervulina TaxID=5801 RepID=U6GL44_EIMAC|nr:hypothetical protein EAH_00057460 [Eimeria acervulina]CDI80946.1 hypothetical protein EAH_00057460 [Eimeria acervulina]
MPPLIRVSSVGDYGVNGPDARKIFVAPWWPHDALQAGKVKASRKHCSPVTLKTFCAVTLRWLVVFRGSLQGWSGFAKECCSIREELPRLATVM